MLFFQGVLTSSESEHESNIAFEGFNCNVVYCPDQEKVKFAWKWIRDPF